MRVIDQIQELQRNLVNMPLHTDTTAKIPLDYSQNFPKNLMDYSAEKMEDFVNPNLSIIEEIGYRQPNHIIPAWFANYQKKYYSHYNILKGDSFFDRFHSWQKYNGNDPMIRGASFGNTRGYFNVFGRVNGADLSAGGTSFHQGINAVGIYAILVGGGAGVVGQYYDQAANNVFSGSGNEKFGIYADNGSNHPGALLSSTSSGSCSTGYNWKTMTEFALTTARVYCGLRHDATADLYQDSSQTFDYLSHTYANAFPDPFGTPTATSTDTHNCKIGHS